MKLIRLQAFKEVMNAGTVTEASRRLQCSQPRISRLISELEEEIGFPLFIREKQRLEPTTEAKLFYQETERILLGLDDIERIAEDIYSHRETCLRVLAQSHIAHGLLNHVFGEFEVGGTSWLYLADKELGGSVFPELSDNPAPGVSESIQHGLFAYFVPPIAVYALLGGIMWLTKDKENKKG